MLKEERHRRIHQFIEADGHATVSDLSHEFGVSEMTIRRDLQELGVRGLIMRVHGGAITPNQRRMLNEPPILDRIREQAVSKRRIGQAVASMIKEGETIYIGSGTTALAVAEALRERSNLTVVTNALTIANALATSPEINVIVVGGFLRISELSLIGHIAEAALHDLRVDKVIMGMRGIDPEYGLTSDHHQELMTDRAIMAIGDTVIIVADHTKFGHVAASRTAPIIDATLLVTDKQTPDQLIAKIRSLGVEVILV